MDYNGFTSYGYESHFVSPKPPAPPPIAKVSTPNNYGWPVNATPGMPPTNQIGGQWVSIPDYSNQGVNPAAGNFPKKGRQGVGFHGKGGMKRNYQATKPFDPTGKTPAMLLHELFKDITEKYEEVTVNQGKRYKCVLSINGQEFSMEGTSKKIAKQKASEQVIRSLRPDIPVTPYEETTTQAKKPDLPQPPPQPKIAPNPYAVFVQPQQQSLYGPVPMVPPPPAAKPPVKKSGPPPSKRAKIQVPAVDSALSLVDAVRKLCVERIASGPYNPVFEYEETSETGNIDNVKKKFICILSFPEKNIKYTAEGVGRNTPKDIVCLKALKEEFGVTESQIRAIMRRNVMGKGGDMPIVQTLHHVANLCHCTVSFKTEPVEPGIGIGTGRHLGFTCELTLTDHTLDDKVVVITSDLAFSKHDAKENVCRKMLKQHFEIDPEAQRAQQPQQTIPPCQQLQVYCAKRFKRNDSLKFEDLGTVGVRDHNSFGFKFKCVVEGREFYGTGPSKKEAKNSAALEALRVIFGNGQVEETSLDCYDLTEYVKREHHSLCMKHGIEDIPTQFAAFVFLNAEKNKRMVSLAAVTPGPIPGETVIEAKGTVLHMMDPIILARRALIRYLLTEIVNYNPDAESNILIKGPDGLFQLKSDIRLALYSTYAPGVFHSRPGAEKLSLSTLGHRRELVTPEPQTLDEIKSTGFLKCFTPADKMFKWTHIGVQGALLTTLMHPIVLDTIYFGTAHPEFSDEDLKFSFFSRICPPTRDVKVESCKRPMHGNFPRNMKYVYLKDMDMEYLRDDGRRIDDGPSELCKASIYRLYLQANPSVPQDMPYLTAKANAVDYNHNKRLLYEQLEARGYGTWHSKPHELSDFTLSDSFDETQQSKPKSEIKSEPSSQIDFSADL